MKNILGKFGLLILAAASVANSAAMVQAATVTDAFDANIVFQDDCEIVTLNNLDFGTHGLLSANIDSSSTMSIQCTLGTSYDIGLNFGIHGFRRMANGGNTIFYDLYTNATYSTYWDGLPFAAVGATGTGSAQTFTVYGRVFAQFTPPNGTYTDTITVTVTF